MAGNAKVLLLAAALALTACDRQSAQSAQSPSADARPVRVSASTFAVARLAADRAALDDAHARCKARAANATPELCAAAAEATRRRFTGSSRAYEPTPVNPFPSKPH